MKVNKTERVCFTMTKELYDRLVKYAEDNRFGSLPHTVRVLVEDALAAVGQPK